MAKRTEYQIAELEVLSDIAEMEPYQGRYNRPRYYRDGTVQYKWIRLPSSAHLSRMIEHCEVLHYKYHVMRNDCIIIDIPPIPRTYKVPEQYTGFSRSSKRYQSEALEE